MKIGVAGPATLAMLAHHVCAGAELPPGYKFAPMATWVEALLARGHQVVLFTSALEVIQPRTFKGDRLTIHVGRYRRWHRARDFFAVERQDLLAAMRADPCDIIHAHWTYEFAWAALDTGRPVLVTAHDAPLQILRFKPDPYRFVRLLMAMKIMPRIPFLTAVSPYIANQLKRYMRYRNDIPVVPNSLSPETFALGLSRKPKRRSEGFTIASILTGWKGRKNGPVALRAFHILRERFPDAKLILFGEEYAPVGEVSRWAHARALDDGVEFAGAVPYHELLRRLADEADALLHTSLEESFGMTVAEAMALGIPVVAGENSGAVPWVLENGRAGKLVDVRSPMRVAAALAQLASDPDLCCELGEAARRSACNRFRSESVCEQYEEIYRKILQ